MLLLLASLYAKIRMRDSSFRVDDLQNERPPVAQHAHVNVLPATSVELILFRAEAPEDTIFDYVFDGLLV